MTELSLVPAVFYLIAAITVVSGAGVAFSRNIVYSAFALMGTLLGAAGLYVMLAADFVAVIQVLIYVGGILVLTLFAVMLTHRIADVRISNRSVGRAPSLLIVGVVGVVMARAVVNANWQRAATAPEATGTSAYAIGNAFLSDYVLPFEVASVVLLAALIGAVVLSRKELRER
jgi:NAD(P)H-quinone oxidoreductase subunit 6